MLQLPVITRVINSAGIIQNPELTTETIGGVSYSNIYLYTPATGYPKIRDIKGTLNLPTSNDIDTSGFTDYEGTAAGNTVKIGKYSATVTAGKRRWGYIWPDTARPFFFGVSGVHYEIGEQNNNYITAKCGFPWGTLTTRTAAGSAYVGPASGTSALPDSLDTVLIGSYQRTDTELKKQGSPQRWPVFDVNTDTGNSYYTYDCRPFLYVASSPIVSDDDTLLGVHDGTGLNCYLHQNTDQPNRSGDYLKIYIGTEYGLGPSFAATWQRSNTASTQIQNAVIFYDADGAESFRVCFKYKNTSAASLVSPTATTGGPAFSLIIDRDSTGTINGLHALVLPSDRQYTTTAKDFILGDLENDVDFGLMTVPAQTTATAADIKNWLKDAFQRTPPSSPDPYSGGGTSGPGGFSGTWNYKDDRVGVPVVPTISAINNGFVSLIKINDANIQNLAALLFNNDFWNGTLISSSILLRFTDPLDFISAFMVYPFDVGQTTAGKLSIMSRTLPTVQAEKIHNEYVTIDCGKIHIDRLTGTYIDNNNRYSLFLPFVGSVPLRADDIMDKYVGIVYRVDLITGACSVFVTADDVALYQYNGQCGQQIPITAKDHGSLLSSVVAAGVTIVGAVATSGASVPISAAAGTAAGTFAMSGIKDALNPDIQRSGSLSGPGGMLNHLTPYLIVSAPVLSTPEKQGDFIGYALHATYTLGDLSGFTSIEEIHLDNIPATPAELAEIETLLKGGVIL